MERCTLSQTIVCCLLTGLLLPAIGCGGDDGPQDRTERFSQTPLRKPAESGRETRTACSLIPPARVARLAGRPGVRLEPASNNSTDLSICDWRGGGLRVQLQLDTAPRAQLRFYNQHSEQLEFYNQDPERRPYDLKNVGDDKTYGATGAWWTRPKRQLIAYDDNRILRVRAPDERGAARLARVAFRRLSEPAG